MLKNFARVVSTAVLALLSTAAAAFGQATITANKPYYNFQVLAGSTRQISANITGGTTNKVNWSILSTTGGATATFTNPTNTAVSSISNTVPLVQVNIGTTAGSCSIPQSQTAIGTYTVTSTATVTVLAQSVDNTASTATFLFNVCANTTKVFVAPGYQQAYSGQHVSLQSWVMGNTNESGTWSITSQPSGGNGILSDTTLRDADFYATVSGRYTLKYTSAADNTQNATAIVYVSTSALPIYSVTPQTTQVRPCDVDPALTGADYEVGAGKAYADLVNLPAANTWTPGTIIRVWNTDTTGTNPSVYYDNVQFQSSGTATQPEIICGVPDSAGNLPIIDGNNANTQSGASPYAAAGYGIISTWAGGYGSGTPYGYWQSGSAGPNHITIMGLHIRNGTPNYKFKYPGTGTLTTYIVGAACVNLRSGSYIDIVGNYLDTCTNGIFTAENSNSAWAPITQQVTVRGNHFSGSGWSTDYTEHQAYFQSFYGLFEDNILSNYLSTALGSNVKWRGVEGIFRYNVLDSGPSRAFDLVENQDATPYVSFEAYLSNSGQTNCYASLYCSGDTAGANIITAYQESAQKDYIYGNMIYGASTQYQIHYAEDHDGQMGDKNGTLYFFNNTLDHTQVVFDTGSNGNGYNPLYQSKIIAQNNILWTYGSLTGFDKYSNFVGVWTTNLFNAGTFSITPPLNGGSYNAGTGNGWSNLCDVTCLWSLQIPADPNQYGLSSGNFLTTSTIPYTASTGIPVSGSAAINAGSALPANLYMKNRYQVNPTTGALTARAYPLTIGAYDQASSTPTASSPTFSPTAGTYSGAQSVALSTTSSGAIICYNTSGSAITIGGVSSCPSGSTLYSSAIAVNATSTIYAVAGGVGYLDSSQASSAYTITFPSAATPTFSPVAGTYTSTQSVTIGTSTTGATIYYTTDGTTPTTGSSVYSSAISVAANTTIKAIAVASGYNNSTVGTASYIIAPYAATPTFSPVAGTYTSTQSVSLSTTTSGATIYYTTDGSTPTTSSSVYSSAISVSANTTIKAIAVASGYTNSTVGSATYTITPPAATPTFSPVAGSYSSTQSVTISTTTPSATIYYTTDGSTPTTSSSVYSTAINVRSSLTIKAIAIASGYSTSTVSSAAYTITPTAATPTFSPVAGTYTAAQSVTINTTTTGSTIYYTTDGSTPTTSSSVYTGAISVGVSETIKAIAVASGYNTSNVGSAAYIINLPQVAEPSVTPATGTYTSAVTASVTESTPGATIYYTLDGSVPTSSSSVYTGPINISTTTTLNVIAMASGYTNSNMSSRTYTITLVAATPTFSPVAGSYTSVQSVSISSATSGVTIYYTTNGSTPTTSSSVYSTPIPISATTTLQAIAVKSGYTTSAVASGTYNITLTAVSPSFSPAPGTYSTTQSVVLTTTTPGSTIYYTTDGSTPTTSSTIYTSGISVSATTTIKAIAVSSGYVNSPVSSGTYTIIPQVAPPSFTPAGGTFSSTQLVSLSDSTSGSTIYFTTNGSTPTTSSTVYTGPITVSTNMTIRAIAVANGYLNSVVVSNSYYIQNTVFNGSCTILAGTGLK